MIFAKPSLEFAFDSGASVINREIDFPLKTFRSMVKIDRDMQRATTADLNSAISRATGFVQISNDESSSYLRSKPGVSAAFSLFIMKDTITLAYQKNQVVSRVFVEDGALLKGDISKLHPTRYFSSVQSIIVGRRPSSYVVLDQYTIFVFDEDSAFYPGIDFDVAVYEGTQLLAVWGQDVKGLHLNPVPSGVTGIISYLRSKTVRQKDIAVDGSLGMVFTSATKQKALDLLASVRTGSFSTIPSWVKGYLRPTSLSLTQSGAATFLSTKVSNLVSLADDGQVTATPVKEVYVCDDDSRTWAEKLQAAVFDGSLDLREVGDYSDPSSPALVSAMEKALLYKSSLLSDDSKLVVATVNSFLSKCRENASTLPPFQSECTVVLPSYATVGDETYTLPETEADFSNEDKIVQIPVSLDLKETVLSYIPTNVTVETIASIPSVISKLARACVLSDNSPLGVELDVNKIAELVQQSLDHFVTTFVEPVLQAEVNSFDFYHKESEQFGFSASGRDGIYAHYSGLQWSPFGFFIGEERREELLPHQRNSSDTWHSSLLSFKGSQTKGPLNIARIDVAQVGGRLQAIVRYSLLPIPVFPGNSLQASNVDESQLSKIKELNNLAFESKSTFKLAQRPTQELEAFDPMVDDSVHPHYNENKLVFYKHEANRTFTYTIDQPSTVNVCRDRVVGRRVLVSRKHQFDLDPVTLLSEFGDSKVLSEDGTESRDITSLINDVHVKSAERANLAMWKTVAECIASAGADSQLLFARSTSGLTINVSVAKRCTNIGFISDEQLTLLKARVAALIGSIPEESGQAEITRGRLTDFMSAIESLSDITPEGQAYVLDPEILPFLEGIYEPGLVGGYVCL